jgi:hypothetical protein
VIHRHLEEVKQIILLARQQRSLPPGSRDPGEEILLRQEAAHRLRLAADWLEESGFLP